MKSHATKQGLFLLLLVLQLAVQAAAQPTNRVVVSFTHEVNGYPLVLNDTEFTIWNGKKMKLTRADFYLSELAIQQQDGTEVPLTDQYLLVSAKTPNAKFDLGEWPVESAHGMTLHIGVPESVNHNDPAAWPNGHPLAPKNPTMHWGWVAGYIFLAVEGRVDNDANGVPETHFEMHSIDDILYRTVQVPGIRNAQNDTLHIDFTLDYARLFQNLTLDTIVFSHGSGPMNKTMMDNAATRHFITWPIASSTNSIAANSEQVVIRPNPAHAETWVAYDLPATGSILFTVTNAFGQPVFTQTGLPPAGTVHLNIAHLPAGLYYGTFYADKGMVARKKLVVR